ncbi:MAG: TIGR03435 family protein [Acidobacteria bacterium]|nr:TIGR03435 family protein [Acidobacteriota bacterium]
MNALLNHLWQSTLFAAGVFAVCFVLRTNAARTRYWLWLAASMKFLIPFSALVAFGTWVDKPRPAPVAPAAAVEQIAATFSPMARAVPAAPQPADPSHWPLTLAGIWACGSAILLLRWLQRWRTVHSATQTAEELPLQQPLPVRSSPGTMEPGIFGVFRPVLLLPDGLWDRLDQEQFQAVLAHELCHFRYRDNLTAALHMCVEVLFWFHPLVWWIGSRLVEERERACDEAVLVTGSDPAVYAQGIVNVCKYFVAAPLPCATGISGADLRGRIAEIMMGRIPLRLTAARKSVLAAFLVAALATPVVIGVLRAQTGAGYRFEVASIRPAAPGYGSSTSINTNNSRLTTRNASLFSLITFAYRVQSYQVIGAPDWARDDRYDIAAKYDTAEEAGIPASDQKRQETRNDRISARMRNLLAERFQLKLREDTKELPIYGLVEDRGGHKLKPEPQGSGSMNVNQNNGNGTLRGEGVPVNRLATTLSGILGRPVVDETGLTELYAMDLKWSSEAANESGPSLFTALREQLGLKLESKKGPVTIYIVERVEKPSEN